EGGLGMVGFLATCASSGLSAGLALLLLLFLLRVAIRKEWLSLAVMTVVLTLGQLGGENVGLETPFAFLQAAIATWSVGRIGLVGVAVMVLCRRVLGSLPLPLDLAAPYTPTTLIAMGLMLALAAYALRISIGTRPLFSVAALEE